MSDNACQQCERVNPTGLAKLLLCSGFRPSSNNNNRETTRTIFHATNGAASRETRQIDRSLVHLDRSTASSNEEAANEAKKQTVKGYLDGNCGRNWNRSRRFMRPSYLSLYLRPSISPASQAASRAGYLARGASHIKLDRKTFKLNAARGEPGFLGRRRSQRGLAN